VAHLESDGCAMMATLMHDRGWQLRWGGATEQGGRSSNQDRYAAFRLNDAPGGDVFVVADGMGGHGGGARASDLAVLELERLLRGLDAEAAADRQETLSRAFVEVDALLQEAGRRDPRFADMGTTLVAAWVADGKVVWSHAGDSRLYRLRGGDLDRLTRDQNLAFRLWEEGRLTDSELRSSPYRCALMSYVGGGRIDVESGSDVAQSGDRFVLLTDGIPEVVPDGDLRDLALEKGDPKDLAAELVGLACERQAQDNVTALCFTLDSP